MEFSASETKSAETYDTEACANLNESNEVWKRKFIPEYCVQTLGIHHGYATLINSSIAQRFGLHCISVEMTIIQHELPTPMCRAVHANRRQVLDSTLPAIHTFSFHQSTYISYYGLEEQWGPMQSFGCSLWHLEASSTTVLKYQIDKELHVLLLICIISIEAA